MTAPVKTVPGGLCLTRRPTIRGAIVAMPLPSQIVLPLQQHAGHAARALVEVGERVVSGQAIGAADGTISAAIHASASGVVNAIESRPIAGHHISRAQCIVIDCDEVQSAAASTPRDHDYHLDEPDRLRQEVSDAGLAGLGGAVFPTAVKLAASVDKRLHTLVINGAECDPAIGCDDALMREHADGIVAGARCMLHILQINQCVIATKEDKAIAGTAMREAVDACGDERLVWREVPTMYPQGGERQLIQRLSGQEVPTAELPLDIGFLCHNVATAYAVYRAIEFGEPLTSRIVTVCGQAVAKPQTLSVPLGTSVADVIAFCGGYINTPTRLIMGGEMMGQALDSDAIPVTKACNSLLVMDRAEVPSVADPLPCIRCGDCASVCPASLQPQQLHWHSATRDLDALVTHNLFDCIECGCCDLVCPSHIPLTQLFRNAKHEIATVEADRATAQRARARFDQRNARLERQKAERKARRAARTTPAAATETSQHSRKDEILAAVKRAKAQRAQRENDHEV